MYEQLTVDEHLRFFSALRGAGAQVAEQEVADVLQALGLTEKRNARCGKLSGGQKRRLWVATALIGNSPLVFLDEPSSGMDPASRRELWNILLSMKARGRTILFTTHYLEEADILADRKAVLAKGRVKAVGTSKELKTEFGTGYHLKVLLPASAPPTCKERLVSLVLTSIQGSAELPVADVERNQAADAPIEVEFTLPVREFENFGPLFSNIEAKTDELQVLDLELGMTSLEDVFMALGKEKEKVEGEKEGEEEAIVQKTKSDLGLEFQKLEQEEDNVGLVSLSKVDYVKILLGLRTREMRTGKVGFMGLTLPVIMTIYGTATSTGFFTHGHMMSGTYAIFPGFMVNLAGMRLLYTVVLERTEKIKHVIISQGMPSSVYWGGTALHSGLQMLFVGLVSLIPLIAFSQENVLSGGRLVFLLLVTCIAPFVGAIFFYLVSWPFQSAETATKTIGFLNVFISMFAPMVPNMLWNMTSESGNSIDTVAYVFHNVQSFLNPFYPVGGTMIGCWRAGGRATPKSAKSEMDPLDISATNQDFGYYAGRWEIWAPIVGAIFQAAALAFIAFRLNRAPGASRKGVDEDASTSNLDDDVLAERKRAESAQPDADACLYQNLHHTYFDKERTVRAVRGISLGIKYGECFGLLGPNGAGKTTTLGCLTGEIRPPTCGEVYVAGHSVTAEGVSKAYEHLGNCPQIDPIFPLLSGRVQLSFYGRMKGVPPKELAATVDGLLKRLGIDEKDRDKEAKTYSGGMKRKLSLAIAFIGRSDVLFLDEPSAGVDASAKRLLWQAIKMRASKKTVIITTHSMEEAEATCDRIAIQVTGQLRCIGSTLHLKSKYGSGYQLEVRLLKQGVQAQPNQGVRRDVLTAFLASALSPDVQLLEAHEDCFLYQLPSFSRGGLGLGKVFTKLQEAKQEQGIEDYCLSQPSLEQVFLRFAREQQQQAEP